MKKIEINLPENIAISKIEFITKEDCCGRTDHCTQNISIEIEDGGGGAYSILQTERFALDPDSEFLKEISTLGIKLCEVFDDVDIFEKNK